jgi:WD40 repeat protein
MTRSFPPSYAGKPVADLSPGGRFIAIGRADGTIQVITAISQSLVFVTAGHTGPVSALAWSPDGQWLASGGDDHMVYVWNATNGATIGRFPGHSEPISFLVWSPDSTHLASSSGQQVRQWGIEEALGQAL